MAYDVEEQEKLDAIKDWWDKNGLKIIILAVLFAFSVLGWRGYQWYEQHQATKAMGYFEALEVAATQDSEESKTRILAASEVLRTEYSQSAYTSRAVLIAAQALMQQGDLDAAKEQLQWLVKNSKESAIVDVARLRLSGVLLEQADYKNALEQIQTPSQAFLGLYADRRGDIHYAQGEVEQARSEWQQALAALNGLAYTQIVQLKLDALTKEKPTKE